MPARKKPNPAAIAKDAIPEEIIAEAPAAHEAEHERELRIAADVFNPNESDLEYAIRRGKELGVDILGGKDATTDAPEIPNGQTTIANMDLTVDQMAAESPARESRWPTITERRSITVPLSEEDLAGKAAEMTEIILERDRTKLRAKNAAAAFKSEVEELDERLGAIAHKIDSGGDEKSIPCTWIFETFGKDTEKFARHFPEMPLTTRFGDNLIFHPEYKTLLRDDSGEVVETALITNHDRQMALSLLPETGTEPEDPMGDMLAEDDGAADLLGPVSDPDPTPDLFGDEEPAAYHEGWADYDIDKTAEDNPHSPELPAHADWLRGWTASKDATITLGDA